MCENLTKKCAAKWARIYEATVAIREIEAICHKQNKTNKFRLMVEQRIVKGINMI